MEIIYKKEELDAAEDVAAKATELERYASLFRHAACRAARKGYIDDVIEPATTRFRIVKALEMLADKRDANPRDGTPTFRSGHRCRSGKPRIVTALGMSVVFIGLWPASASSDSSAAASRATCRGAKKGHGHGEPRAADGGPGPTARRRLAGNGPGDVLAVIAAVLEVERTLYMNRPGARVTIRRHAPAP